MVTLADVSRYLQKAQDGMKELTSTQRKECWHAMKVAKAGPALVIYQSELALAISAATFEILGVELIVEVHFLKQAHIKEKKKKR